MTNKHTTRPVDPPTTYSHKFWESYTRFLAKQAVDKLHVEWHVFQTKQYIALFPEQHIHSHSSVQVEQYLHKLGQDTRLASMAIRAGYPCYTAFLENRTAQGCFGGIPMQQKE